MVSGRGAGNTFAAGVRDGGFAFHITEMYFNSFIKKQIQMHFSFGKRTSKLQVPDK